MNTKYRMAFFRVFASCVFVFEIYFLSQSPEDGELELKL